LYWQKQVVGKQTPTRFEIHLNPGLRLWSHGTQENIKHKYIVLAFVETYGGESFILELAQDSSGSL